jgi:hypothetical protein
MFLEEGGWGRALGDGVVFYGEERTLFGGG